MHISLNNFSSNYKTVLSQAVSIAVETNTPEVIPPHILYSLFRQEGSIGSTILKKTALKPEKLEKYFQIETDAKKIKKLPQLADETIRLVEHSAVVAQQHNHQYIGTEHLLAAFVECSDKAVLTIFKDEKVNTEFIRQQLDHIFNSSNKFNDFVSSFKSGSGNVEPLTDITSSSPAKDKSILEAVTTDLTNEHIQKHIDPVIGREREIERLIEILMRRTKNNPMILGDPGIGKTAIVEGLAKKITEGSVPSFLMDKKILALDLGLLIAGTMFRGEFENRMKQVMEEVKQDQNIIIFIDEIHNIIGAGSTQGSMDVANILKPALARGEIRCIGATTFEEYKKYIEGDAALERRFQTIKVAEPTKEQTQQILDGIKDNYEVYHNVSITDEAVTSAVHLSTQYISDRRLPDKAIDLIDEASARVRLHQKPHPLTQKIKSSEQKLKEVVSLKQSAILEENFKQAVALKKREEELMQEIDRLRSLAKAEDESQRPEVTAEHVAGVLADATGIPTKEFIKEKEQLLSLEKSLSAEIIGQEAAVAAIAKVIQKSKTGVSPHNRPMGSFLFIGPSGVGKTYTAKMLAEKLFHDPKALIRIDMSEFSEKFTISKLIGAPAGYVGYKESGKLTDSVKQKPYSVVLFDEVEKAHPEIFNLLLQVLDEGYLTDATGRHIDFRNTIIIMTSNLGAEKMHHTLGFGSAEQQIEQELESEVRHFFKPEFVNRLDDIITFYPLSVDSLKIIAEHELQELTNRLKEKEIILEYTAAVPAHIIKKSDTIKGARAISQYVNTHIGAPIAELLLKEQPKTVKIEVNRGTLSFCTQ